MHRKGGPSRLLFWLLAMGVMAAALAARRWLDVVEVRGRSMAPALLPGDRLLIERLTYARRPPRIGEVVLAADPREPTRELVKRVIGLDGDAVEVRGDAVDGSTDSRTFGGLPSGSVRWRAVASYWPPGRWGALAPVGSGRGVTLGRRRRRSRRRTGRGPGAAW